MKLQAGRGSTDRIPPFRPNRAATSCKLPPPLRAIAFRDTLLNVSPPLPLFSASGREQYDLSSLHAHLVDTGQAWRGCHFFARSTTSTPSTRGSPAPRARPTRPSSMPGAMPRRAARRRPRPGPARSPPSGARPSSTSTTPSSRWPSRPCSGPHTRFRGVSGPAA